MRKVTTLIICMLISRSLFAMCGETSLQTNYTEADVVFTGIVAAKFDTCKLRLGIQSNSDIEDSNLDGRRLPPMANCHGGDSVARVEVNEIYKDVLNRVEEAKGKNGALVYAHTSIDGIYLVEGREYLLFAKNPVYSIFLVGGCDGSTLTEYASNELSQLKLITEAMENAP